MPCRHPPDPVVPSEPFARRGISPRRRLGQNFLIDLNIHELIVKTAEVGAGDVVLEIGSGTGALTSLMAGLGAAVVAVDVDPAMARLTAESTAGVLNVRVLYLRCAGRKHMLHPEVLDNVRSGLAAGKGERFKLVANLPYHVATPVITNLLIHADFCPVLMVVTIQRELADRLCATAASPPYGALSVVVQALADVSLVRSLPPSVFWPGPKSTRRSSPSGPIPSSGPLWGTSPFFMVWFAGCSCTGANICATRWQESGATSGTNPRSMPGSVARPRAARSAPRCSISRSSSRCPTRFASDSVSCPDRARFLQKIAMLRPMKGAKSRPHFV